MARTGKDLVVAYTDNKHVATHNRCCEIGTHGTDTAQIPESHRTRLDDERKEIIRISQEIGPANKEASSHNHGFADATERLQVSEGDT